MKVQGVPVLRRFYGRAILAASVLTLFALALISCGEQPDAGLRDDAIAAGRRLYVANCTVCHGEQGDKVSEAPLNLKRFLDARGDAMLLHLIAEGKGVMPAWGRDRGGPLSRDEIDAVVVYLNSVAGRTSPSLLANSGRNVYYQQCARCHGDRGDRIPVAPLAAKPFLDARTDDQLFQAISDGKGLMPAFRTGSAAPLTADQVQAVVSYLRYNATASVAEEARRGRELYASNCLPCHGDHGDRVPNVALATPDELRKLGDGGIVSTIADGKGVMPAFASARGGAFQVAELAAVLAYLKSWAGLPVGSALRVVETPGESKELYTRSCSGCHGENGDRVAGVSLKSHAYLDSRSDNTIVRQISQGNAHGMPAWGQPTGGPLPEKEIKNLLTYLRSVAKTVPVAVAPDPETSTPDSAGEVSARGKQLFRQSCAACHGEGRDKVSSSNLADRAWLEQRGDELLRQSIAYGKGSMPSWAKERGGPLTSDDIQALVSYLRSTAGDVPATAASEGQTQAAKPSAPVATTQPTSANVLSADAVTGQRIFTKNCVACHGESRDRMASAKLADPAWLQQRGDAALSQSIAGGKGAMPALSREKGGVLSESDIAAVLAYLKELAGIPSNTTSGAPLRVAPAPTAAAGPSVSSTTPASTPAPATSTGSSDAEVQRGKELYTKNCTACHGETRDRMPTAKLADAAWLQARGDATLSQSIAEGKGGMPGRGVQKGGPLSAEDVAAIIAYLKSAAGLGR